MHQTLPPQSTGQACPQTTWSVAPWGCDTVGIKTITLFKNISFTALFLPFAWPSSEVDVGIRAAPLGKAKPLYGILCQIKMIMRGGQLPEF